MGLIDFCEIVIKTYDTLIDGEYNNSELIFSYIDCLFDYCSTIIENKESIVEDCITKANYDAKDKVQPDKIRKHIDTFYYLISEVIHKHTVFHFEFLDLANFEKI